MATPQQSLSQYEAHLHYASQRIRHAQDVAVARGWTGEEEDLSQVLYVLTQLLETSTMGRRRRLAPQEALPGLAAA
jgi:hypothetical protein